MGPRTPITDEAKVDQLPLVVPMGEKRTVMVNPNQIGLLPNQLEILQRLRPWHLRNHRRSLPEMVHNSSVLSNQKQLQLRIQYNKICCLMDPQQTRSLRPLPLKPDQPQPSDSQLVETVLPTWVTVLLDHHPISLKSPTSDRPILPIMPITTFHPARALPPITSNHRLLLLPTEKAASSSSERMCAVPENVRNRAR